MRILPSPNVVNTKNSMFQTGSGPADYFNYSYSTNHFWFKLIAPILSLFMRIVYRVKVTGLENVPKNTNFIVMANHISHADSFFAIAQLWRHTNNFHFIGDEKLFKNPMFRIIAAMFNVFPVRKGARSMKIVDYAIARVNNGDNLLWYPEGQRHKDPSMNKCNPGKLGSGKIAHAVKAPIVPVFLAGPEFAMPVGGGVTYGKKIRSIDILISFGKPVHLDDLRELPEGKEASEKVVERVMENIEALRPVGPYHDQSYKL